MHQLSARREQCLESLLRGSITLPTDSDFGLDDLPSDNSEIKTNEILRHIVPEQAVHPGELVHIIKHDQLEPKEQSEEEIAVSDLDQVDSASR